MTTRTSPATATLTFSQVISATLASVAERKSPSAALLRRHARRHLGSSEPRLVEPIVEAVRDELYRQAIDEIALRAWERATAEAAA